MLIKESLDAKGTALSPKDAIYSSPAQRLGFDRIPLGFITGLVNERTIDSAGNRTASIDRSTPRRFIRLAVAEE